MINDTKAYGYLSKMVPLKIGKCSAGEDKKPPKIGPIVRPIPPITPYNAMPLAALLSSSISAMYVLDTPTFPLSKPHINRENTANSNDGEKPKLIEEITVPINPYIKTGLRPILSDNAPHKKLPNKEPKLKAEPVADLN